MVTTTSTATLAHGSNGLYPSWASLLTTWQSLVGPELLVRDPTPTGGNVGGMPVPEEVLDDDFVLERLCLEFPDGEDGEPVITIGNEVLEAMNGLWKNCMLVKVLGRSVPLAGLVREPSQPADGFTVVGRGGKRMEYQKKKAGGSAGSSGSVLGNNRRELEIRKDSGNISLSNSFGKLREDLAGPEGMENTGVSDSNKENVNNSNQLRIGERDTQGKSIHFGAGMEMNKVGNRFLNKEKRPLAYKAIVSNGPKPRYQNMNRPTRGLVFGQRRDEPELSKSGKRLRVERSNLGKSGGAVVYGKDVSSFGSESKQTTLDASRISQVESGQSTEQMEEALGIVPVEMEDASCVA
ncbi:unnamed protein product [Arabidopsis halleri]